MPLTTAKHTGWLLLAILALNTAGCSALRDSSLPPQTVQRYAALDYPADAPHGPDLDIYLVVETDRVRLVNRTPYNYSGMQLWLNYQYVRDSGTIQIGTGNERLLTDFINRHAEPYPVGTLLNADQTQRLVLAELYNPAQNVRHRLLVRDSEESSIIPFEELNN